jgi:hypothetical protein
LARDTKTEVKSNINAATANAARNNARTAAASMGGANDMARMSRGTRQMLMAAGALGLTYWAYKRMTAPALHIPKETPANMRDFSREVEHQANRGLNAVQDTAAKGLRKVEEGAHQLRRDIR